MATQPIIIEGLEGLMLKIDKLQLKWPDNTIFSRIGILVEQNILQRTANGEDVEGGQFKPYSEAYLKKRKSLGLPTTPDLFFSGDMLSAMTFTAKEDEVRLFFLPTQDKEGVSNPAKAFWNDQTRRFFALSAEDINEINRMFRKDLVKLLES
jgi:hypothetical protein